MKGFIKLVILLLAAYGAYCFYDNHIKKNEPEPEQVVETADVKKEQTKPAKRKSSKTRNKGAANRQSPAPSATENDKQGNAGAASAKASSDDDYEEEVEEAAFIPKTR